MNLKELIRAGWLTEARQQLIDAVKRSPGDTGVRVLLFQVLSLFGEWEKAERHMDVIAAKDAGTEAGVMPFKILIQAETARREMFQKGRRPGFLPKTPPYAEFHFSAVERLRAGEVEVAAEWSAQTDALIPGVSGTVNGKPFSGIRDTDAFLSPFLEAFVHERYVWIPFEAIRELILPIPESLFDTIWIPAHITVWSGLTLNCYLPVVYPDSSFEADDRIKMGRMTDWRPLGGSFYRGVGQHVYQIGEEDVPLLEIRELILNQPVTEEAADSDD